MNNVRLLSRKDIEAYIRLIRLGYLEAEREGVHYSAFSKSREELMEWLIKTPTWGLFNEKNMLIGALSLQFGWNRKGKKDLKKGMILLKHCVVLAGFKNKGNFQYLFRWVENNIIKRILRANSVFVETDFGFNKSVRLYVDKLGFSVLDKHQRQDGCMVLEKKYLYDCVPEAFDYDDVYRFLDISIRPLTEKDAKEFCAVLHEGSRSSVAEGIDYSFGHFTEEECYKRLIELPTWGLFGDSNQLVAVGSFEFPWQLTYKNKTRKHVLVCQTVVLKSFYRHLIKTKMLDKYIQNYRYRLFKPELKFSLFSYLWDYLIGFYLVEMLKCTTIYNDTAYGSQAMNVEINDWGMEIVEHIYSYNSTPHAVLTKMDFTYE